MDKKLQAIRDAFDKEVGGGRDYLLTRALADQYVADNPGLFTQMQTMTVHELVRAVEVFRDAGMVEDEWRVQAFLFHRFEPQQIGGPAEATVRITQNG